jgi:hypothetical protein
VLAAIVRAQAAHLAGQALATLATGRASFLPAAQQAAEAAASARVPA